MTVVDLLIAGGAIYLIGVLFILTRLVYLMAYRVNTPKGFPWRRKALLDSLLWPYYVLRYGVETFYQEIK